MTEEDKAVMDAVEKVNNELYEKYEKLDEQERYKDWLSLMPTVTVTFAGYITLIGISVASEHFPIEIPIYMSEEDDRIYYEDSNKYEDWYKFIKRKFKMFKQEIKELKL